MGVGFENTCTFSGKWNVSRRNQGLSSIIYKEFLLLIVTPSFHISTSLQQSQKEYMTFNRRPTLPPSPEASPGDTWTRSLLFLYYLLISSLSTLVSTSQITVIAMFADRYKIPLYISQRLQIPFIHYPSTHSQPHFQSIFSILNSSWKI